jgi:hypothetical protein
VQRSGSSDNLTATSKLVAAEHEAWTQLHELIDVLSPEQAELPGY